jgi:drug/metabolite transporter (DMT)-like permease
LPKHPLAVLELFIGSVLWAFSFVATSWCLESFSPSWIVGLRFLISFSISIIIFHVIPRKKIRVASLRLAIVPSLLLSILMLLTAWGQKYTTATNTSFITCLYILFVPLFERFVSRKKVSRAYWLFILLALIGAALMCKLQEFNFNGGDFIVLIGSVFAGAQIFWFGLIAPKIESSFEFNTSQSFLSMLLPLAIALSFDPFPTRAHVTPHALWGILIMGIGSTLIGFALQVRGQRKISATTASIIYQVESPIAAIFAYFLLNERMTSLQLVGAALIFAAALGASIFGHQKSDPIEIRQN